ncbi:3036_t:CDS:1, partial [Dentiscutata heterogama]
MVRSDRGKESVDVVNAPCKNIADFFESWLETYVIISDRERKSISGYTFTTIFLNPSLK